jgi:hypothetical protein
MELCVRPSKVFRCSLPVGKEDSERCTLCLDYRVPDDDPLVVCEVCEIFGHKVGGRPLALPCARYSCL